MKLNLTQMADGYSGQEHSFPIQPLYKDVVEFVARTKTFYTPTILVAYGAPWSENYWFENEDVVNDEKLRKWVPWELLDGMVRRRPQWFLPEEYGHERFGKQVADIVNAGGKAALGSHGQLQGLGAHWETWSLGSGGLTPHETLRVVTLYGAEAIGLQQDLGSIEPGKLADLLVLDGNPLVDLRQDELAALRDEERRAVRRQHAGRGVARGASAAEAVLVGDGTVGRSPSTVYRLPLTGYCVPFWLGHRSSSASVPPVRASTSRVAPSARAPLEWSRLSTGGRTLDAVASDRPFPLTRSGPWTMERDLRPS